MAPCKNVSENSSNEELSKSGVYQLGDGNNGAAVIAPPANENNIQRITKALQLIKALNQVLINESKTVVKLFDSFIQSGDMSVEHLQVCSTS